MSANLAAAIALGLVSAGLGPDTRNGVMNKASGPFYGHEPFGPAFGFQEGLSDADAKKINMWKLDTLGSGTANAFALIPPTASAQAALELQSGTGGAGTGQQVQSSNGATTTAFARWFAKSDQYIHGEIAFKVGDVNAGLLIGLTEVNTAVLSSASAIGAAAGIFAFKATGAQDLSGIVRRGGVSNSVTQLVAGASFAASTVYKVGFRFDTRGGSWFINDQEIGVDFGGSAWDPNAALAFSVAVAANAGVNRVLTVYRLPCFQEAF